MGLKVKFGSATDAAGQTDAEVAERPGIKIRLDIRKTLSGDLIIHDHPDIDIIVMPKNRKILALAKKLKSGVVYGAQSRLFDYLQSRGIVTPDSVQGGNVFASMEGAIPEAPDMPAIKIAIINIARWMEQEEPALEFVEEYEQEVNDDYTDPDKEYSTELGQVPQAAEKGSIRPSLVRGPYGVSLYNYYGY
jgi:hypothetical protein